MPESFNAEAAEDAEKKERRWKEAKKGTAKLLVISVFVNI
jgi:hypothetical protein